MSTVATSERETFLAERKAGIGGTDAAAILGASPWKTPLQVYAEKVGIIEEPDLSEVERIEWGNRLEPFIAKAYAEKTGRKVFEAPGCRAHTQHPQIIAHVDRLTVGVGAEALGPTGVLECKNVGEYMAGEWEPEPPIYYAVQLQHYLMVTGAEWGSFAALLGGNRLHVVDVPRNEAFCEMLLKRELEFWDRVQRRDPPDVGPLDRETLARMFPNHGIDEVRLPAEASEWDLRLAIIKAEAKALETEREEIENRIKAAIGEHQAGLIPGGGKYTWKLQERAEHVVKASSFRVLRRGK